MCAEGQNEKEIFKLLGRFESAFCVAPAEKPVPEHLVPWWLLTKMLFCLFDADLHLICIYLSYESCHMGDYFTSGYVLMSKHESKLFY